MYNNKINVSDRIVSVLTYITGGFVGVIWLIYCSLKRKPMTKFILFNIYQSIFLSLFLYIANLLFNMVYHLLAAIPFISRIINGLYFALYSPIYLGWSIVGLILLLMYIYLMLFSLLGKTAYIPWVSNIILYQLKRF